MAEGILKAPRAQLDGEHRVPGYPDCTLIVSNPDNSRWAGLVRCGGALVAPQSSPAQKEQAPR